MMSIEDARAEMYKLAATFKERVKDHHRSAACANMFKKLARATFLEEFLRANDPSFNVVDEAMMQTKTVKGNENDRRNKVYNRLYAKLEARKQKNIQ